MSDIQAITNAFYIDSSIIKPFMSENEADLSRAANLNRINCLAGLFAAKHGWVGACFSCIELLTCIYAKYIKEPLKPMSERASLHISKGHAAMAQYAVLSAMGCFSAETLLSYKRRGGLPAHCDRSVPGADSDSGSLGQGLSKAIGNALANQNDGKAWPVFALIGDGEMQEGQVFEALLSARKHNPRCLVPIIDCNLLQSDSLTTDIKGIKDWGAVLKSADFEVYSINGHETGQIIKAIDKVIKSNNPCVIIANTQKGHGCKLSAMGADTQRRQGVWHAKIPNESEYYLMLKELVEKVNVPAVSKAFEAHLENETKNKVEAKNIKTEPENYKSTGQAFADALVELAGDDKDVYVLDADLEKACRLTKAAEVFKNRFIEVGISEQDMVSIASGLALAKKTAVANTYASFFKRCLDQVFASAAEESGAIFAGHYAGIDYFTDGKSHQSLTDIGIMRSLSKIEVFEPCGPKNTREILKYALEKTKKALQANSHATPIYIRLHRTGCKEYITEDFAPNKPFVIYAQKGQASQDLLVTAGPHMLKAALEAVNTLSKENVNVDIAVVCHFSDKNKILKNLCENARRVYVLEDSLRENSLAGFAAMVCGCIPVRIGAKEFVCSALSLNDMLEMHKMTANDVAAVIRKVRACSHHQ